MSTKKHTRREFILSAAAAAAAATASVVPGLPTLAPGPGRAHLVGLGNAGGAFLDVVLSRLPADFDRNVHRVTTEFRADLLERSFLGLDQAPFKPGDPIVFLVGLGGSLGRPVPHLVKAMLKKGHQSVVVASLPWACEGRARRRRAEDAARAIEGLKAQLLVVDYQVVLEDEGSSEAAFRRVESLAVETALRTGRGLPLPVTPSWSSYPFSDRRDIPLPRF